MSMLDDMNHFTDAVLVKAVVDGGVRVQDTDGGRRLVRRKPTADLTLDVHFTNHRYHATLGLEKIKLRFVDFQDLAGFFAAFQPGDRIARVSLSAGGVTIVNADGRKVESRVSEISFK